MGYTEQLLPQDNNYIYIVMTKMGKILSRGWLRKIVVLVDLIMRISQHSDGIFGFLVYVGT